LNKKKVKLIAGVDEVGRGPLAGPVISCAVILPLNHKIIGLKDSKKLSKKKREELYPVIIKTAISYGIGRVGEKIIDKINIREATIMSMNIALDNLSVTPEFAYIDGEKLKNQKIPNKGVVGGDNLIDSIKAASIIAKVTRDKIMKEYSIIFPHYDFENNNGYGTKKHMEGLVKYKSSPIHRTTFKPVSLNLSSVYWIKKNNLQSNLAIQLISLELIKNNYEILKINKDCINDFSIHVVGIKNKIIHFFHIKNRSDTESNYLKFSADPILIGKLKYESVKFFIETKTTIRYKFMIGLITLFNSNPNIQIFEINVK